MAPFLTLRGTPQFARHYKILYKETAERLRNNDFPVPNEKYRLMWDNIAPWHQLRKMSDRLAQMGANIVAAPYTSCLGSVEGSFALYKYDGQDPIQYLARTQNGSMCPYGLDLRVKAMGRAIAELTAWSLLATGAARCFHSCRWTSRRPSKGNTASPP